MKKIFVLDTSVIIFDHNSILSFDEHDIVIPITVLEELDTFKKGNDTKNFEAREFIRFLDKNSSDDLITEWMKLPGKGKGKFKIVLSSNGIKVDATKIYDSQSNDNKILNAALKIKEENKRRNVILVTKDVNLRLKAKALGLRAEDYETGKVENIDNLNTGILHLNDFDQEIIDKLYSEHHIDFEEIKNVMPVSPNQY